MNTKIILDTKLVGNVQGVFYVPSYQRGYRWGKEEVTRLLEDIYTNGNKTYCLQPVVVRKDGDRYELIDGQQRLTTLFILLQYIKREYKPKISLKYELIYETRESSAKYLNDINETLANSNIDFYHIYYAYKAIDEWFKSQPDSVVAADDIYGYLVKFVKIIWYEVGEDEDAISLFTRLNIGKIPLTSAELVKAIFLSRDNTTEMDKEKQEEISLQWDNIEKELHHDRLWYFLTNSATSGYQTRIDLILDLISGKPNVNQLSEEKKKIEFLDDNPGQAKTMFELEDHPMLKGQIGIIGIENLSLANMFAKLFTCNWDKIDRALMATGNYRQEEKNGWRYQCASKSKQFAWDELFHRSANYCGFDNTKKILIKLLQGNATFTNEILDGIADGFIASCTSNSTYPWRYYYVKYDAFRPGSYGKLRNSEASKKPYLFSVMQTKTQWSQNTYMPYLKIVDDYHLSHYDMGQKLLYDDRYIVCENASYKVKRIEDNSIIDTVEISQDKNGIDKEDRVQKLKNYLSSKTIPKTIP